MVKSRERFVFDLGRLSSSEFGKNEY